MLVPNQTNYAKRNNLMEQNIPLEDNFREYKVMYLAYDITSQIKKGKNVVGSILGNGFYNPAKYWAGEYGSPRFIGQLHITFTDGSEQIVVSDESWKAAKSAILMDMVYYGEHYDARLEQNGSCTGKKRYQEKRPKENWWHTRRIPTKWWNGFNPFELKKCTTETGKSILELKFRAGCA